MSNPTADWDLVPVYGTWEKDPESHAPLSGTVQFAISIRINLASGRAIYPMGFTRTATLDETGTIHTTFPAVDDPNIVQQEWKVKVTEKIAGQAAEYWIQPRLAHLDLTPPGLNLGNVIKEEAQTPTAALIRGMPGGVAGLDADGDVIDAFGRKVTGGPALNLATPRIRWTPDNPGFPAWANVNVDGEYWTSTRPIPPSTTFGREAAGWWQTGWENGRF